MLLTDRSGNIALQIIANSSTPNILIGNNLSLGVALSAWALGTTLQIGNIYGTINFSGTAAILGIINAYYNGTSYVRQNLGSAASYEYNIATSGCFAWRMSGSDSAGTSASLPIVATLSSNGFEVGYTSVQGAYKLDINGTGRFTSNLQAQSLTINTADQYLQMNGYNGSVNYFISNS